ncbi:unnamed protein product [Eruca vesicaria subsp. sativa]|uniref:Uncharacterized protein n=1 Tax=Eruca vesicaria subsp. sativa TaxID=29727 RepID=A0ABC8JN61_ERUVS|nr:unnamed protein product [Eruca vesicaria subsp. sativa]
MSLRMGVMLSRCLVSMCFIRAVCCLGLSCITLVLFVGLSCLRMMLIMRVEEGVRGKAVGRRVGMVGRGLRGGLVFSFLGRWVGDRRVQGLEGLEVVVVVEEEEEVLILRPGRKIWIEYGDSRCLEIGLGEGCAQVLTKQKAVSLGKSDINVLQYFVHLQKEKNYFPCRCFLGLYNECEFSKIKSRYFIYVSVFFYIYVSVSVILLIYS